MNDIISSYSRQHAIEDGVLIDVTGTAREAGFRYPVALTRAVWTKYIEVPEGVQAQDEAGRLWDILWMLSCAIRRHLDVDTLFFGLSVRNHNRLDELVTLKAVCGAGDDLEPVITVMLPDED
ncbi:MAG: hypothetical protein K2Y37_01350 [Pirellulales bacterium]|nr:hypothetical protein [Pirellulales bacterium]